MTDYLLGHQFPQFASKITLGAREESIASVFILLRFFCKLDQLVGEIIDVLFWSLVQRLRLFLVRCDFVLQHVDHHIGFLHILSGVNIVPVESFDSTRTKSKCGTGRVCIAQFVLNGRPCRVETSENRARCCGNSIVESSFYLSSVASSTVLAFSIFQDAKRMP